jgi:hypothetical protein
MTVENKDVPRGVLRHEVTSNQAPHANSPVKLKTPPASSSAPFSAGPVPSPPTAPLLEDDRIPALSPTGAVAKQADTAARRRAAAEWVAGLTGDRLPVDTDLSFRRHLRDGVLLCKLINAVKPGTVTRVSALYLLRGFVRQLVLCELEAVLLLLCQREGQEARCIVCF